MKHVIFFFILLSAALSFSSELDDINLDIKSLNSERLQLSKLPFVEYRSKDHPSINIEIRNRRILVNRSFVSPFSKPKSLNNLRSNSKAYSEWSHYVSLIPDSDARKIRLASIDASIKKLTERKQVIIKSLYQNK